MPRADTAQSRIVSWLNGVALSYEVSAPSIARRGATLEVAERPVARNAPSRDAQTWRRFLMSSRPSARRYAARVYRQILPDARGRRTQESARVARLLRAKYH